MFVKVLELDRLICHYGWMLNDVKGCKKLVGEWGFDVKDELRLVDEARQVLSRLRARGWEVI